MKKRLISSLFLLFLFFALGAAVATYYIENVSADFSRLLGLHQIEDLRQELVISVQMLQSDLYRTRTPVGSRLDKIKDEFRSVEQSVRQCGSCHHAPDVAKKIEGLTLLVSEYRGGLKRYVAASGDPQAVEELKLKAAGVGDSLLLMVGRMANESGDKLKWMTDEFRARIRNLLIFFYGTIALTFVLAVVVAWKLTYSVTAPVRKLAEAAREIASGSLGYTVPEGNVGEFGELAAAFNKMSLALKESYAQLEEANLGRQNIGSDLVKSQEFLGTIFDSIRDPFCILDGDYSIVMANEAYAQMKKVTLADLAWQKCYERLEGRTAVCADCIVQKTFRSGDPSVKEKMVTDNGMESWVEIFTYPMYNRDRKVTHVIEYTRDVTERKRAEEALRNSEERYALAARGANDGLWDWDLKSNRVYFSYRWKSMLGYDEDEIGSAAEEWLNRIHADDRGRLEIMMASHLDGRSSHFESEYRISHKDGSYRWMLCRGLAVRDRAGRAYRIAGSQTDITAKKRAEEQLIHDAFHDSLTGLPNRALFMDRLRHIMLRSDRRAAPAYAVLFLDIDRFKVVNDSMGHLIGDRLLIAVAGKLSACIRPTDTIARFGGDEFAILLENISNVTDATDVARRIKDELSKAVYIDSHEIFTGASIGIAMKEKSYVKPENVLRDADIAMYQAKAKGNSSYEVFRKRMHANILDRLQIESDLHRAIERREFILHYQPIIDLREMRLRGFEALIRWRHPERGLIMPMEFIPIAEEIGLIFQISDWTAREAFSQLKKWQESYPSDPRLQMSINISSKEFLREELASRMGSVIDETGLEPGCVVLEITESMIMTNMAKASETMRRLRKMGIHIHIDDFGTGYSSLNYLQRFPVSALKIDRSFIRNLAANTEHKEIVASIISLAQTLNLEVIAEGVEVDHQLLNIKEMKCRFAQGMFFSMPLSAEDAVKWITGFGEMVAPQ